MKILVADKLPAEAVQRLEAVPGFEVTVKTGLTPEQLADFIEPFHGIIIRSASKVTASVAEKGKNLKVVVRAGVGLDNVDRKACEAKGIKVSNTPSATSISVAELALGLMLSLARHIHVADATMKAGKWEKKSLEGTELYGKTLGLIGAGRIGRTEVTPESIFKAGFGLARRGKFDMAEKMFSQFLETSPDHKYSGDARYLRAACLEEMERYPVAIEEYRKVYDSPASVYRSIALFRIGVCQDLSEDYPAAMATYDKFLVEFPDSQWKPAVEARLGQMKE